MSPALNDERTYIDTYDMADARHWRRIIKGMSGCGEWLRLSVFQCSLSRRRRAVLEARLRELVKAGEDHVLLIDVGLAHRIDVVVVSSGKTFGAIERHAVVI